MSYSEKMTTQQWILVGFCTVTLICIALGLIYGREQGALCIDLKRGEYVNIHYSSADAGYHWPKVDNMEGPISSEWHISLKVCLPG
jgi:hypothetical protein